LVRLVILAQVRELPERATTVAAGTFVFAEAGCEFVCASREA
jgi:hypothetical protein